MSCVTCPTRLTCLTYLNFQIRLCQLHSGSGHPALLLLPLLHRPPIHPLHGQHVSSNPDTSSTSDRHTGKFLSVSLSVCPFYCYFSLFLCLSLCLWACSYIHCTGNMFLLIPTQVELQTGIEVSFCLFLHLFNMPSSFVSFCVCLLICLCIHPLHWQHVSLNSDTSSTSDRHSSKVFICFFVFLSILF